ncbi:tripartite tricarboxylate transporter substrate binding protein [Variovorax sp. J31P207]|uniref:Bug family tripartite tricarboxylate transporter substrate binding protein n=1 Tax=Variovorax sp. J31P207 TaxID=3053510 RepID=UPI002575E017|nr:tripartite tricarboxylate transporter substrate binding protein [Variovorax sp. J31P207]MDM0066461.1 tripartite tricarboxylate transporter substrate binding protein [Variovorax sp. J31P207]
MKHASTSRTFAAIAALALGFAAQGRADERPEAYPSRPIHVMLGFAPGGSTDAPMRVLAQKVGTILKQPVVIENKPGAGGVIPTQNLQAATPDGYTLAIAPASVYRLPYTQGIKWDPSKDLSYVIGLTGYAFGIVVPAGSQIKNLNDFVAYAKANPGKLTYSTPGVGTTNHLTMEQVSRHYGVTLNHIPYKGSAESLQAIVAGQVDSAAETSAFVPYVDSGKLRLIAVWGSKRMSRYPDVPTLKESGLNIVQTSPWGLVGPKGMDPVISAKLHDAFRQAMETKEFKDVLGRFDMEPDYKSPKAYQAFAVESMKREKEILDVLGLSQK